MSPTDDVHDLGRLNVPQGPALDGLIVSIHADGPAADLSKSRDYAVSGNIGGAGTKFCRLRARKGVELYEGPGIEKERHPFFGAQRPFAMEFIDLFLAAAERSSLS
jgi:hypothetical protein